MRAVTTITNEALIEILESYGFQNPKLSGIYNIDVTFDIDFKKYPNLDVPPGIREIGIIPEIYKDQVYCRNGGIVNATSTSSRICE